MRNRSNSGPLAALMLLAVAATASCVTFNSSGYETLSASERSKVVECREAVADLLGDGHVYLVTTDQLQEYLNGAGRVLIYEYLYYCRSEHCVNPLAVEQDCRKQGVQFLLVLEDYEGLRSLPRLESPALAADPAPLGKKITKRCATQFFDKLTSTTLKTRGYGRYYLFTDGTFAGCYNDYTEALKPKGIFTPPRH